MSAIENAIEKLEWFGTVRGRLGVAFDRVFVYGTGGFAFLHPSQKPVGPPVVASKWAFAGKRSTKIEGLYYDLGSLSSAGSAANGFMVGKNFDVRGEIVRVGLNYRFN